MPDGENKTDSFHLFSGFHKCVARNGFNQLGNMSLANSPLSSLRRPAVRPESRSDREEEGKVWGWGLSTLFSVRSGKIMSLAIIIVLALLLAAAIIYIVIQSRKWNLMRHILIIDSSKAKWDYEENEDLDTDNLKVYVDGKELDPDDCTYSYNLSTIGKKIVTVNYDGRVGYYEVFVN